MDYEVCPECGGKLNSDGEWVECTDCEQAWFQEDYANMIAKLNNTEKNGDSDIKN